MKRLNSFYPNQIVTLESLRSQDLNFFIIGTDGKNPWGAQSHKLKPLDVLELSKSGIIILATPHIGILWPSNLMYPYMGVIICDFTGNQSFIDYADEPEKIQEGSSKYHCALEIEAMLSPYLHLDRDAILGNGFISAKKFAGASNLAHVHHSAKKMALAEGRVIMDIDLYDVSFTFDFFQVLIENQDWILSGLSRREGIFDRFVSNNGVMQRCEPGKVADLSQFLEMKKSHRVMINEDTHLETSGFFPINEANILFDSIHGYYKQIGLSLADNEIGDTYAMSGVDMINYTKNSQFRGIVDRMYKALLNSGKFSWLPEYMAHTFFPGGVFRFLPSNTEDRLYEDTLHLFNAHTEKQLLNTKIAQANEIDRMNLILENNKSKNLKNIFTEARDRFQKSFSSRRGLSQYDLLNGEFVPIEIIDQLMPMSFEQIGVLFKTD